jgi:hypothetical protein
MEEGFVRAVHTGTGLEQDIPLAWFDVFPGAWREAGTEAEEAPAKAPAPVAAPPAVAAPAVPAPVEAAPAPAPAPEGDAA